MSSAVHRRRHRRSGPERATGVWRLAAACALAAALAACTPSPEEVIPGGYLPDDGIWCSAFSEEDITAMVGLDELDRVRMSGTIAIDEQVEDRTARRDHGRACWIVWADGGSRWPLASVSLDRISATTFPDPVGRLCQTFVCANSGRLENLPRTLAEGVYAWGSTSLLVLTFGHDADGQPVVEQASLAYGSHTPWPTDEQLTQIGLRLQDALIDSPRTPADARPFTVQDINAFTEEDIPIGIENGT